VPVYVTRLLNHVFFLSLTMSGSASVRKRKRKIMVVHSRLKLSPDTASRRKNIHLPSFYHFNRLVSVVVSVSFFSPLFNTPSRRSFVRSFASFYFSRISLYRARVRSFYFQVRAMHQVQWLERSPAGRGPFLFLAESLLKFIDSLFFYEFHQPKKTEEEGGRRNVVAQPSEESLE
jgi:hypothetical protein